MHKSLQNIPNRIEIHRVLELLSDYHSELIKSSEKLLTLEIARILRVMKSKFFQALIDIQEYYKIIVNEEQEYFFTNSINFYGECAVNMKLKIDSLKDDEEKLFEDIAVKNKNVIEEVLIFRGNSGLGFSIAGGIDNMHSKDDNQIYITKISPGGAAAADGRLHINDVIKKVNNTSLSGATHASAVNILKNSGDEVKIQIQRRYLRSHFERIDLYKEDEGFGFSIAGGIENQHFPGKNGIFITRIINGGSAHKDGRLKVGSQLLGIENSTGKYSLTNISHDDAVKIIKSSQHKIILFTESFEK